MVTILELIYARSLATSLSATEKESFILTSLNTLRTLQLAIHVPTLSRSHILTLSRSHVLTLSRSHVLTLSRSALIKS